MAPGYGGAGGHGMSPVYGLDAFERNVRLGFEEDPKEIVLRLQRLALMLAIGAAVEITPGNVARIVGVVLLSPVGIGDTSGSFRASWQVSEGPIPLPRVTDLSEGGRVTPARLAAQVKQLDDYGVIWVASAHPAGPSVELGLYPKEVLRGTWNRKRRRYEIRSDKGYSKQARAGVIGVTAALVEDTLRRFL